MTDVSKAKQGDRCDSAPWPDQYGTWAKIPNHWLWQWIHNEYNEFSWEVIAAVQKAEKQILRKLLRFDCGIHEQMSVDARLRDKRIMSLYMKAAAAAERGHRLRGWVQRAFADRKKVNWNAGGAFKMIAANELVTHIVWSGDALNQAVGEGWGAL